MSEDSSSAEEEEKGAATASELWYGRKQTGCTWLVDSGLGSGIRGASGTLVLATRKTIGHLVYMQKTQSGFCEKSEEKKNLL